MKTSRMITKGELYSWKISSFQTGFIVLSWRCNIACKETYTEATMVLKKAYNCLPNAQGEFVILKSKIKKIAP